MVSPALIVFAVDLLNEVSEECDNRSIATDNKLYAEASDKLLEVIEMLVESKKS